MDFELFMSNYALYISYILFIATILIAVVGPIITALNNPQQLLKGFLSIIILLVVFFISYLISGDEVTAKYLYFGVDATGSKLIGGSIIMVYFLFGITILGIFLHWIVRLIR